MKHRRFAAALGWLAICASAAPATPNEDIAAIAGLVRENYFDEARGGEIAAELLQRATAEKLDALTDRGELALRLTTILREYDGHFRVEYDPDGSDGDGPPRMMRPRENPGESENGYRPVQRLPGDIVVIGLIHVAHIDFGNAEDPARRTADAALAATRDAKAVILDLRGNGGGAPSMVGYLVSAFVKPGANVYNTFHSRRGTGSERPQVEYPQPNLDVPLYVLTNRRTASAAESIAFTLQSCGRATVVGERSAGGANPGRFFRIPEGYRVFVSTGSPRNPINGKNWEGTGVVPDVVTEADAALEKAAEIAGAQ